MTDLGSINLLEGIIQFRFGRFKVVVQERQPVLSVKEVEGAFPIVGYELPYRGVVVIGDAA